jgi:release factor glutamine methyltransferase
MAPEPLPDTLASPSMDSVQAQLRWAQAQGLARADAQWLLAHALQRSRQWLYAHADAGVDPAAAAAYAALVQQALVGVPIAQLIGHWSFAGLELRITPEVLVPRPETEGLLDWGLQCLAQSRAPKVLDLGTGSGALALALKSRRPEAEVWASDASAAALAVAANNAGLLGLRVRWLGPASWWQAVPADSPAFDLVLANPPYIADNSPYLRALRHEPLSALVAADEGLADLRAIVSGAAPHLQPGAWLLLEHGHDQALAVREALQGAGFAAVQTRADLAGLPRCSGGRWTG